MADEPLSADEMRSDRWVTVKIAMDLAGVSRRTISNWIAKKKIRVRYTAGGGVRIERASLFRRTDAR